MWSLIDFLFLFFFNVKFPYVCAGISMEMFCLRKLVHEVNDEIECTKLDQWSKYILKVKEHNSIAFSEIQ